MLEDVAGTGGLKVLSMYVRTFGYGMVHSRGNERPNRHVRNNVGSDNALDFQTSFCNVILSHDSENGQKVSNPNAQKEQSFEVLPDGHMKAMEESKTIRNSCRDKCEQCWQQCKNTHNTDHPQATH